MAAPEDGDDKKWMNTHGFPPCCHFLAEDHDLLAILDDKLRGNPLRLTPERPKPSSTKRGSSTSAPRRTPTTRRPATPKKMRSERAAQGGRWKVFGNCKSQDGEGWRRRRLPENLTMQFYEQRFNPQDQLGHA